MYADHMMIAAMAADGIARDADDALAKGLAQPCEGCQEATEHAA